MLNTARDKRPRVSQVTLALVLLIILGAASELARLPAFVALFDGRHYQRVRWNANGKSLQMDLSGEVEFADDDHADRQRQIPVLSLYLES